MHTHPKQAAVLTMPRHPTALSHPLGLAYDQSFHIASCHQPCGGPKAAKASHDTTAILVRAQYTATKSQLVWQLCPRRVHNYQGKAIRPDSQLHSRQGNCNTLCVDIQNMPNK